MPIVSPVAVVMGMCSLVSRILQVCCEAERWRERCGCAERSRAPAQGLAQRTRAVLVADGNSSQLRVVCVTKDQVYLGSHRMVVEIDEALTTGTEVVLQLKGFTVERSRWCSVVGSSRRCDAASSNDGDVVLYGS